MREDMNLLRYYAICRVRYMDGWMEMHEDGWMEMHEDG